MNLRENLLFRKIYPFDEWQRVHDGTHFPEVINCIGWSDPLIYTPNYIASETTSSSIDDSQNDELDATIERILAGSAGDSIDSELRHGLDLLL